MSGLEFGRLAGTPRCVECSTVNDGATNMNPGRYQPPRSGDYTMCIYCGTLQKFAIIGGNYVLTPLTPDEESELKVDYHDLWDRARIVAARFHANREAQR